MIRAFLLLCLIACSSMASADISATTVPVAVKVAVTFKNHRFGMHNSMRERQIIRQATQHVLASLQHQGRLYDKNIYVTAKEFQEHGERYIIAQLHSNAVLAMSVLRINLRDSGVIKSVIYPYEPHSKLLNNVSTTCPDSNIRFLIASPADGNANDDGFLASAHAADADVYQAAIKKYGKSAVKELLGADDNTQNFESYLNCSGINGVFSTASHDDAGQSFFLSDGDFSYKFFASMPADAFSRNIVSFDTCYAYKEVVPGLCEGIKRLSPEIYTGGVTPLPMQGSPETYACFWQHVLSSDASNPKQIISECALQNDPFVNGSQAPLYLVSNRFVGQDDKLHYHPFAITTSAGRTVSVSASAQYTRLRLAPNETIASIAEQTPQGVWVNCSATTPGNQCVQNSSYNLLLHTSGLSHSSFLISINRQGQLEVSPMIPDPQREFPAGNGHPVYGLFPADACGHG